MKAHSSPSPCAPVCLTPAPAMDCPLSTPIPRLVDRQGVEPQRPGGGRGAHPRIQGVGHPSKEEKRGAGAGGAMAWARVVVVSVAVTLGPAPPAPPAGAVWGTLSIGYSLCVHGKV